MQHLKHGGVSESMQAHRYVSVKKQTISYIYIHTYIPVTCLMAARHTGVPTIQASLEGQPCDQHW